MTMPVEEGPSILRAEGIGFGFAGHVVFNGLSLTMAPGVTWLLGDESTGKTTLLRLLAGDLSAQRGTLHVNGVSLANDSRAYRSQVFWVDPRTLAFDTLTAQAYWDGVRRQYPAFDEGLLADLTVAMGLAPHVSKALYMLSTGTKRKVFLAAAFASGATVALLDEPFAALDKASIALVRELLQEAATHPSRAWIVADYMAPPGLDLAQTIRLGD